MHLLPRINAWFHLYGLSRAIRNVLYCSWFVWWSGCRFMQTKWILERALGPQFESQPGEIIVLDFVCTFVMHITNISMIGGSAPQWSVQVTVISHVDPNLVKHKQKGPASVRLPALPCPGGNYTCTQVSHRDNHHQVFNSRPQIKKLIDFVCADHTTHYNDGRPGPRVAALSSVGLGVKRGFCLRSIDPRLTTTLMWIGRRVIGHRYRGRFDNGW